jgi:MinD superfamily P-loop ATPase
MVHAKLGIAAENSGKLVSTVRRAARDRAEKEGIAKLIIDGPPGIGCPVIASITGTSLALIITEPTLSGQHDLVRVARLAKHFNVPVAVCVNKWDINSELTESIEAVALSMGARPVGRIGYDRRMTEAQVAGKTVLDYGGAAAEAIREIWCRVASMLDGTVPDAGAAESGNGG